MIDLGGSRDGLLGVAADLGCRLGLAAVWSGCGKWLQIFAAMVRGKTKKLEIAELEKDLDKY